MLVSSIDQQAGGLPLLAEEPAQATLLSDAREIQMQPLGAAACSWPLADAEDLEAFVAPLLKHSTNA